MKDRRYKIFIIGPLVELVQHRLEQLDYEFSWESVSAKECMAEVRVSVPDIVIAVEGDYIKSFLREREKRFSDLPIIVVSDLEDHAKALEMIGEGAEDYICRDKIERLDIAISRVLKNSVSLSKKDIRSELSSLEGEVLELCSDNQYSLEDLLTYFVESMEEIYPKLIPSVWQINDGKIYSWASSNGLSENFLNVQNGTKVGQDASPCGMAVHQKKDVICSDISEDEKCESIREVALAEGVKAFWVMPILGESNEIYGMFCSYCRKSWSPSLFERKVLGRVRKLLQVVIGYRQAHRSLKLRERRFRSLVQDGADLISILDEEGCFRYVAPFSKLSEDIKVEDFLGKNAFEYVHQEDRKDLKKAFEELAPGQQVEIGPFRSLDTDKSVGWKETTITNMMDNPAIEGYVVNSRDISDQVEREQKLQESIGRYEIVSKATSDTIWDLDLDDDIIRFNSNIHSIFGYDDEVVRIGEWWRDKLHPDDQMAVLERIDEALAKNEDRFQMEYRFRCADGNYKHVYDRAFIVTNVEGRPVRMIGAMQDVTRQRERERVMKNSLREKKTLLMEIHHRVKNNLAVVSGMMQLQAFESESEELRRKLHHSVGRIQTMASIHELLYESQNFSNISFDENIKKLITAIVETVSLSQSVGVDYELATVDMNINQAIPCSLIINEIISNMLKYEYKGVGFLKIIVSLFEEDGNISIKISNNLMEDSDPDVLSNDTLSRELIQTLSHQLEADYGYEREGNEKIFYLTFERSEVNGIGSTKVKDEDDVVRKGDVVRTIAG